MTTERRRFDARRATVGLLIGALGLTAGAAIRVTADAAIPAGPDAVPFASSTSDTQQVIVLRRSSLRSLGRTRAS